jgi:hypothetical protein
MFRSVFECDVSGRYLTPVSQANSIMFNASNATGIYSPEWMGPPVAAFSTPGALAGLDVLSVAIDISDPPAPRSVLHP